MLFDGVCNFCSASVRAVLAMDRRGAIRFSPVQSALGQRLAQAYGLELEDPESFVFFDKGRPLERSEAAIAMARRLPPPWRALVLIRFIPRGLRDGVYDWIARRRYRLFGKRDTCFIPSPEVRARFVLDPPGDD
jgi:predicted DCC family thiol-disulfide oxidoreductase YuxK